MFAVKHSFTSTLFYPKEKVVTYKIEIYNIYIIVNVSILDNQNFKANVENFYQNIRLYLTITSDSISS